MRVGVHVYVSSDQLTCLVDPLSLANAWTGSAQHTLQIVQVEQQNPVSPAGGVYGRVRHHGPGARGARSRRVLHLRERRPARERRGLLIRTLRNDRAQEVSGEGDGVFGSEAGSGG